MRVLVTGGAGFIGSHVVDLLVAENYHVSVVDNLITGRKENVNVEAHFYQVDIRYDELEDVFAKERPEMVLHLAAQSSVPPSVDDPVYDESVNVAGTLHLLELSRKYGVKKFIYSSSAAIYGNPVSLPVKEEHPKESVSPYGLSKYLAEEYIMLYDRMYQLDYTILRYANVYGPRQTIDGEAGVITIFADKIRHGETLTIYGDGQHTRDFVYVGDVARANFLSLTNGSRAVVNISTGTETTLEELAECIKKAAGASVETVYAPPRSGDIVRSCLNPARAAALLNWKPKTGLLAGLKKTL